MDLKEFEESLSDLETRVDRLRALYENWFRGYEKLEPQTARKDVERRLYALRKDLPRNTGLRFRYNTLFQRYSTLTNYWHRTAKQIEEGTYRPQLQRLKRKKDREKALPPAAAHPGEGRGDGAASRPHGYELDLNENLDVNDLLDDSELDAVAQAVRKPVESSEPPAPRTLRPTTTFAKPVDTYRGLAANPAPRRSADAPSPSDPPAQQDDPFAGRPTVVKPALPLGAETVRKAVPAPPPAALKGKAVPPPIPPKRPPEATGLGEQRLRSLYAEYQSARRRNNEGDVRYEVLVSSIERMLPELQKKHAGKRIDFEIVVKNGRVGLKPRTS